MFKSISHAELFKCKELNQMIAFIIFWRFLNFPIKSLLLLYPPVSCWFTFMAVIVLSQPCARCAFLSAAEFLRHLYVHRVLLHDSLCDPPVSSWKCAGTGLCNSGNFWNLAMCISQDSTVRFPGWHQRRLGHLDAGPSFA